MNASEHETLSHLMNEWRRNAASADAMIRDKQSLLIDLNRLETKILEIAHRQHEIIAECKHITCPCLSDDGMVKVEEPQ